MHNRHPPDAPLICVSVDLQSEIQLKNKLKNKRITIRAVQNSFFIKISKLYDFLYIDSGKEYFLFS